MKAEEIRDTRLSFFEELTEERLRRAGVDAATAHGSIEAGVG